MECCGSLARIWYLNAKYLFRAFFLFFSATERDLLCMPVIYDFTCSNGHSFKANAKIRARCPECGITARRNFSSPSQKTIASVIPVTSTGPKKQLKSSSRSLRKAVKKDNSETGLKPASTLKKVNPSSEITKSSQDSETLTKPIVQKRAVVVKRGMMAKRPVPKTIKRPSNTGIVARKKASVGSTPTVGRLPKGSRERKVVEVTGEGNERFWLKAKKKYFR